MKGELIKAIPIPSDCTAKIVGKTVEIHKMVRHQLRCRDCIHRVEGYATFECWYKTFICELKPKKLPKYAESRVKIHPEKNIQLYYGCPSSGKICDNFKQK